MVLEDWEQELAGNPQSQVAMGVTVATGLVATTPMEEATTLDKELGDLNLVLEELEVCTPGAELGAFILEELG